MDKHKEANDAAARRDAADKAERMAEYNADNGGRDAAAPALSSDSITLGVPSVVVEAMQLDDEGTRAHFGMTHIGRAPRGMRVTVTPAGFHKLRNDVGLWASGHYDGHDAASGRRYAAAARRFGVKLAEIAKAVAHRDKVREGAANAAAPAHPFFGRMPIPGRPCVQCAKPTARNAYGDVVCVNPDCFAFES